MERWYWRLITKDRVMTIGHGNAETRAGMVAQISAQLANGPIADLTAGDDGYGVELIIQQARA